MPQGLRLHRARGCLGLQAGRHGMALACCLNFPWRLMTLGPPQVGGGAQKRRVHRLGATRLNKPDTAAGF